MKPEKEIDRRIVESDFYHSIEKVKSFKIAKEAKSICLNRRQMSKNGMIEEYFEPKITTRHVTNPVAPEVDLPALN